MHKFFASRPGRRGFLYIALLGALCAAVPGGSFAQVYLPSTPVAPPSVQTESATDLAATSAVMHGVVRPNGASANVWFEYGFTQALGLRSSSTVVGTEFEGTRVNFYLYLVEPGRTYFFRLTAQNAAGSNSGNTLSFTSPTVTTSTPLPSPSAPPSLPSLPDWLAGFLQSSSTLTAASSAISLGANVDNPSPRPGGVFSYTLLYQNASGETARNAHAAVFLPVGVEFQSATPSPSISGRTLDFDLGTLATGVRESLAASLRLDPNVAAGETFTLPARLGHLDAVGQPRVVSAEFTILAARAASGTVPFPDFGNMPWYIWISGAVIALVGLSILYIVYRLIRVRRGLGH